MQEPIENVPKNCLNVLCMFKLGWDDYELLAGQMSGNVHKYQSFFAELGT